MKKSKIIYLLKGFSAIELREFREYLKSPLFNKQKELVVMYDYIYNMAPHFPEGKIDRKVVYKAVFPGADFRQEKFYALSHALLKLAEEYLGWKWSRKHIYLQDYYIAEACFERGLEKNYREKSRRVSRQLEDLEHRNATYYEHKYRLADLGNRFYLKQNLRVKDDSLEEAARHFDIYFLYKKLPLACETLARTQSLATSSSIGFYEELVLHLEKNEYLEVPFVAIFRQIFFMLTKDHQDNFYFNTFKNLLEQYSVQIETDHLASILQHGINYCVRQIRKGKTQFVSEALEFYMHGLDTEVLLQNGQLSPWDFKNIIRLGLNLKRYDWTENFIHTNSEKLPQDFREDAVKYNLADLYYYKGEWDKTIALLNTVSFKDWSYRLGTRFLLCKVYYESGYEESLLSMIAAFKIFLKRDRRAGEELKKSYFNFLKFLELLRKTDDMAGLKLIREEILSTSVLVDRTWLLRMLEEKI